mmetsp:Transcript_36788/g.60005  ORF Transcript_36788/g.60005 Transcript_36788/m.60005 type:complete len:249 (-) Transcript_36788:355-1101(-)
MEMRGLHPRHAAPPSLPDDRSGGDEAVGRKAMDSGARENVLRLGGNDGPRGLLLGPSLEQVQQRGAFRIHQNSVALVDDHDIEALLRHPLEIPVVVPPSSPQLRDRDDDIAAAVRHHLRALFVFGQHFHPQGAPQFRREIGREVADHPRDLKAQLTTGLHDQGTGPHQSVLLNGLQHALQNGRQVRQRFARARLGGQHGVPAPPEDAVRPDLDGHGGHVPRPCEDGGHLIRNLQLRKTLHLGGAVVLH